MAKRTESSEKATVKTKKRPPGFAKGKSGNPGGLPKWVREMRELAGSHAPAAIRRLAQLMNQKKSLMVAKAAADSILDRAGLKPFCLEPEKLEVTTDGDGTSVADLILARLAALRVARGNRGGGAGDESERAGDAPGRDPEVEAVARAADPGIPEPG